MKFTIAIISYNAEEHIGRCIESCTSQTYRDLEILVVDDNSNDKTVDIVTSLQDKDSRIKLIRHPENRSALQARKTAIQNASSKYLWLIDSDDCIDNKGAIGLLSRHIKANNYPDMVCFGSNDYFENGKLKRVFFDWGKDKPLNEWKLDSDFRPYTRITSTNILKKAVGFIPNDLYLYRHNDLFMFCLVKLFIESKTFLDKPLYRYTLSGSSVTNQKDKESVTKHAELVDFLLTSYKQVAKKVQQNDVDIDHFVELERAKLLKYARSQYRTQPEIYLHALKEFYRNKTPVVVSLTTYSKRIKSVHKVINSLLNQTISVDKIVLWLDEKEFTLQQLPKNLKELISQRFEIRFCPNYKSYKKLIPTLQSFDSHTIITVDDDIEYPEDQIEKLLLVHYENPTEVVTNVARNLLVENGDIQPYVKWSHAFEEQTLKPLYNLIPIGVGGVLYPKGAFDREVLNVDAFMKHAPHGDDIWFKCMTLLNNRKVITTGAGYSLGKYQIPETEDIGLWQSINGRSDSNVTQLSSVVNAYPILKRLFKANLLGQISISQEKLIDFYAKLKLLKKNFKQQHKMALDDAVRGLGIDEYDLKSVLGNESLERLDNNVTSGTDFAYANSLYLEGRYSEAAAIFLRLSKTYPDFKHYLRNYKKSIDAAERCSAKLLSHSESGK